MHALGADGLPLTCHSDGMTSQDVARSACLKDWAVAELVSAPGTGRHGDIIHLKQIKVEAAGNFGFDLRDLFHLRAQPLMLQCQRASSYQSRPASNVSSLRRSLKLDHLFGSRSERASANMFLRSAALLMPLTASPYPSTYPTGAPSSSRTLRPSGFALGFPVGADVMSNPGSN